MSPNAWPLIAVERLPGELNSEHKGIAIVINQRPAIALSNWKMNKTFSESEPYLDTLLEAEKQRDITVEIILCVPFTLAAFAAKKTSDSKLIKIAGQNIFWEEWGAFTGEVSPPMLAESGATYCMIGHSERRKYFDETDETVNKKARALLKAGIIPVVCIGESIEERARGLTHNKLERQIVVCFENLSAQELEKIVILYEPLWSIGTGHVATPVQIDDAHLFIRRKFGDIFSEPVAQKMRVLYGGSVTPKNITDILKIEDVDGVGAGGASLDSGNFLKIIRAFKKMSVDPLIA